MGELYGEWVGLSSPLWSKLVMIDCNPNRLEVGRGYWGWHGKWWGSCKRILMGGQVAREGVSVSHTLGSTPEGRILPVGSEGPSVAIRARRGIGLRLNEVEVWNLVKIYLPSKGVEHWGMTRNWWAKGWPEKEQESVGVFLGKIVCPPTLTMGVCDGLVGPQNSVRTEKVAPVSRRRHMGRPSIKRLTLGSWNEMVVAGREVPRPLQSSVASPMRSGLERESDLASRWELGQSIAQCPRKWHLGQGWVGDLGFGQKLA
jgi:hypothetical protein